MNSFFRFSLIYVKKTKRIDNFLFSALNSTTLILNFICFVQILTNCLILFERNRTKVDLTIAQRHTQHEWTTISLNRVFQWIFDLNARVFSRFAFAYRISIALVFRVIQTHSLWESVPVLWVKWPFSGQTLKQIKLAFSYTTHPYM